MVLCCAVTYGSIASFAPYVYTHSLAEMAELADVMSMEVSYLAREESAPFLEYYSGMLAEQSDDELVMRLYRSDGQEVSLVNLDEPLTGRLSDLAETELIASTPMTFLDEMGEEDPETYTLVVAKNTAKESQVVEALRKAWPLLCVIILLVSFSAALIFARYITRPIKSLSVTSKALANLDFSASQSVHRVDEIGVLAQNLRELSEKLSCALDELRDANTQLKADIDQERSLQRQRSYFFSAASHELKTPITVIKGQLEGMLHKVGRYQDRDTYLAETLQAVNRLERMVQELLMATRLEMPDSFSQPEVFDFGEVVAEQLALCDDWLAQKHMTLHSLITPHAFVRADRMLARRVVDNLVSNAVSYSPEGSRIVVALTASEDKVCFAVENSDVHIPEDSLSRLFEAFYRVDDSRSQVGGTGLGLYLVKTILDIYGGSVVLSNTTEGVLAEVWLPKAFVTDESHDIEIMIEADGAGEDISPR